MTTGHVARTAGTVNRGNPYEDDPRDLRPTARSSQSARCARGHDAAGVRRGGAARRSRAEADPAPVPGARRDLQGPRAASGFRRPGRVEEAARSSLRRGRRLVIAIDTSILVYAHRAETPFHSAAKRCMTEQLEGRAAWAIPWPCVHEFLAIVTKPRVFNPPTPLERALEQVDAWLASPSL